MPFNRDSVRGEMTRLITSLGAVLLALAPASAWAANFIGAESCRVCHQAAYDAWKNSPHARAFQRLTVAQQKDTTCLQCHARDAAQGGDPGVTCETCHGAGQYYWPEYVMRDKELARATGLAPASASDTKACLQCHDGTSPSLKAFEPAAAMKAIEHWSPKKEKEGAKPKSASCPRPPPSGALALSARPANTFVGRLLRQSTVQASNVGKADAPVRVAVATTGRSDTRSSAPASMPKAE